MTHLHTGLLRLCLLLLLASAAASRPLRDRRDERGDVPGWVFITVMSAGIVAAIGSIASDELEAILRAAFNQVR